MNHRHVISQRPNRAALKILPLLLMLIFASLYIYKGAIDSINDYKNSQSNSWDFCIFHTIGSLWRDGESIYSPGAVNAYLEKWGVCEYAIEGQLTFFYPPQVSMLFSGLSYLSFDTAFWVFFAINNALSICILILAGKILTWYRPLGIIEITLLASFLHFGLRTNIQFSQTGAVIGVIYLLVLIFAHQNKPILSGLFLGLLVMKPTFYPLLAFYFMIKREYKLVLFSMISVAVSTLGPLIISGRPIFITLQELWNSFGQVNSYSMNNPSPFVQSSVPLQNLAPLLFRIFNQYSPMTNVLSWVIISGLSFLTFYLIFLSGKENNHRLLDFGLVSILSFLIIYHRNYESFLVIPGVLFIYLEVVGGEKRNENWLLLVIFLGIIGVKLLPSNTVIKLMELTPFSYDSYFVRLIAPIHAWTNNLIFGILIAYKFRQIKGIENKSIVPARSSST